MCSFWTRVSSKQIWQKKFLSQKIKKWTVGATKKPWQRLIAGHKFCNCRLLFSIFFFHPCTSRCTVSTLTFEVFYLHLFMCLCANFFQYVRKVDGHCICWFLSTCFGLWSLLKAVKLECMSGAVAVFFLSQTFNPLAHCATHLNVWLFNLWLLISTAQNWCVNHWE